MGESYLIVDAEEFLEYRTFGPFFSVPRGRVGQPTTSICCAVDVGTAGPAGDSADNPPGEPRGWRFRVVALAQAMP